MTPEERNAWAAYDGHRIDRAELKAVLVAEAMAAMPYNRPCDCGSGLMVRICSLCLERARSAAVAEERAANCKAVCPRCATGEPVLADEDCRTLGHPPGPCHRYRANEITHIGCGAAANPGAEFQCGVSG